MPNSSLQPTVITDVNGKVTTVHKRQERASTGRKSIPGPALPKLDAVQPTGTVLPVHPMMSGEELQEFISNSGLPNFTFKGGLTTEKVLSTLSPEDVSLLKHMVDSGRLTPKEAKLTTTVITPHPKEAHTRNIMLVWSRLKASQHLLMRGDSAGDAKLIAMAVDGLRFHNAEGKGSLPPVTTEEELAGYTAVVEFVLLQQGMGGNKTDVGIKSTRMRSHDGESDGQTVVRNKHLEELIRNRPDSVGAIVQYVNERGMHDSAKRPVLALSAYLDDVQETPAISEGWL